MSTTTKGSALDAMLKQYEANSTSTKKSTTKKTYDLKNYFNTFIPVGLKSGIKRVRVLPTADGSSPFVEMHGHKIEVDGEFKTFACLKEEKNTACPFCEARAALLATGKDSDKELAKKYGSRKMYVVKLIDRDAIEDGVKFWRFNHDYRKEGVFDKIVGVLNAVGDITDVNTGRDLNITVNRNDKGALTVSSIVQSDSVKLSTDEALVKQWTTDTRTWEDVYSVKTYDYLEIIVKGGVPRWDKVAEKFVDKASLKTNEVDKLEQELTVGVENVKSNIKTAANVPATAANTTTTAEEGDDLPF